MRRLKPDPLNLLVNTSVGSKFAKTFLPLPIAQGLFLARGKRAVFDLQRMLCRHCFLFRSNIFILKMFLGLKPEMLAHPPGAGEFVFAAETGGVTQGRFWGLARQP